jgi:outer membrane protein
MRKSILIILFSLPLFLIAQQTLTLKAAIDTVLKNSFEISISRNNVEINKLNNTFGNAGGLPSIGVSAADNVSLLNSYQKLNTGAESTIYSNSENSLNTEVSASMYLFNGFKITATKQKLDLLQKQSEVYLNMQIQSVVEDVMKQYYDIIRQEKYLKILQASLDVSNKKLEIEIERKKVGMANDIDFLQAQIDVNNAQEVLKLQQLEISQGKLELLNYMSSKKINDDYIIDDSIEVDTTVGIDSILDCLQNNPQYIMADQQIKIGEQLLKETDAQRYPSLKLNTAYNFANSSSEKGLTLMNEIYGPSVGLSLQIPIYDGNIYGRKHKAILYEIKNSQLEKEQLLLSLQSKALQTYQAYISALSQLKTQKENYELAKELLGLVLTNFQSNQATILEVKAAQTSFENAAYMLVNLQYTAKIAEIELQSLVYKLKF